MKPHYRLHCNFGDAKPLWWVTLRDKRFNYFNLDVCTRGFSTAAAAIAAAARL